MSFQKKDNVLFVVRALPYEAAGTPIVIRNLLANLPKEGYYVLGRRPHPAKRLPNNVKQKMFQIPILYTKGHRFWKYFSILPGFFMGLWIVYRYKITKIVGVFQDDASLILAYRLANFFPEIEFYPYMMDLYAEQQEGNKKVEGIQQHIFSRARMVLVSNEGMKDFLDTKFHHQQIESVPIISQSSPVSSPHPKTNIPNEQFVILFSGSVNEDRLEPLRILTKLVATDKRFTFKFLTSQSEAYLRNQGVFYDGFKLAYCKTPEELMYELNKADLLYLPLMFTFPQSKRTQMMTCFGAKVFDYMISETPILIHSPNYFYNYTFFKENQAAYLLDSMDEDRIKEKLDFLYYNVEVAGNEIQKKAQALAHQFKGEHVANKFRQLLDIHE